MAWKLEKWSFHDENYDNPEFVKKITNVITETAGFVPLAVRFKQMEQAGLRARFFESEFTSHDFSDMYLNHPEFDIMPEDDLEDVIEKTKLRDAYIMQVKAEAKKRNAMKATTDEKAAESKGKAAEGESVAE